MALTGVVWPNAETDLSLRLPLLEMSKAQIGIWTALVAAGVIITTLCWGRSLRAQPSQQSKVNGTGFKIAEIAVLIVALIGVVIWMVIETTPAFK